MYESMKGILTSKNPQKAVVEANRIGYRVTIPLNTYTRLPEEGKEIELFLSQVIREDSHTLYGFFAKEERDLFELLITLSGIGPKTALSLIGHLEMGVFQKAIQSADIRLLSKIPGIGKKTAERLVIEMRDKFKGGGKEKGLFFGAERSGLLGDALSALLNLGYHSAEAQKAVEAAIKEKKGEEDLGAIISAALQKIS